QTEEPAFLDRPLDRCALRGKLLVALPVDQFAFIVIGLVADRVPTLVAVEIQVAVRFHGPPDRLAGVVVLLLGGPNETIVRNAKFIEQLTKIARHLVRKLAGSDAKIPRL